MNIFSGNSLWQLVSQSDTVSKGVLLILFGMSVACWAIFIGKLALLSIKERQFKNANKKIQSAKTVTDLVDISSATRNTAPGYFITKNLIFFKELSAGSFNQKITNNDWELLERNIDNSIEAMLLHNEEYLALLSSSAAVAPLLGLFGTVWGLVHSFMRISETQVADIATIAPGIAEALITTLAGLIVAIPALIMFNYLHTKTRTLEHSLITLADRVTFIFQQLRER
ncbi:MAG TPA: MotA/TolQ/ExbB proton channel family protein [Candidatus Babeliales bacterium]|jgi:biopolymer transport protein TolQ|nr:MotA/TolQ/ExbB proton channel family protein [Candidatus Babeliales bacterium]